MKTVNRRERSMKYSKAEVKYVPLSNRKDHMANRMTRIGAPLLVLLLFPTVVSAELRRVQIGVTGLD